MLMFSCLGMEPCFYFPFSMTAPPSDLNLCMLVCIAAVSFCSCVHQFLCFLGIFCYIWPLESSATSGPEYLSASSSDYLSSLILEGRFSQSFPIGTEYYETLQSLCIAVRLRVRYISHQKGLHLCALFETLITLCSSMSTKLILFTLLLQQNNSSRFSCSLRPFHSVLCPHEQCR